MSVEALSWAWSQNVGGGNRMLVLVALADACNQAGECWWGQDALASKTGATERTVRDALGWLEDRGLIDREERHRRNGSRTSDLIRLGMRPEDPAGGGGAHSQVLPTSPEDLSPPPEPKGETKEQRSSGQEELVAGELVMQVKGVLATVAARERCPLPSTAALIGVLEAFPDRDALRVAQELDWWAEHGKPASRKVKNVASTYRNFMRIAAPAGENTARPGEHRADATARIWRERAEQWEREDAEAPS